LFFPCLPPSNAGRTRARLAMRRVALIIVSDTDRCQSLGHSVDRDGIMRDQHGVPIGAEKNQRTSPSAGASELVADLGDRLDRRPGPGLGTCGTPDGGPQAPPHPPPQDADVLADERTDSLPPPAVWNFPSTSGREVRDGCLAIDDGQTRQAVNADRHHEDAPE